LSCTRTEELDAYSTVYIMQQDAKIYLSLQLVPVVIYRHTQERAGIPRKIFRISKPEYHSVSNLSNGIRTLPAAVKKP
jgi:hypothetical protein